VSQHPTTQEAIALLLDLAERGEIDPWNVDVIDVVDRFLSRLYTDDCKELRESGQALLYAAMLVQLKANTLEQTSEPEPQLAVDNCEDVPPSAPEIDLKRLPPNLETLLHRRPVAPAPAARRVTLAELIAQIEEIAEVVQQKANKGQKNPLRQSKTAKASAMKAIAQLAHKENLSETAIAVENYLDRHRHRVVDIDELASALQDQVGVFWGLLLLSAQNKVQLFQADFYGKIYVERIEVGQE